MKIVIDIPEDFYINCKEWVADECANIEQTIIAEGMPLDITGDKNVVITYLEDLVKLFERGKENCAGNVLTLQQQYIDALQYAIRVVRKNE